MNASRSRRRYVVLALLAGVGIAVSAAVARPWATKPIAVEVEQVQARPVQRGAQRLFAKQEPREKRRLLNFLLSNCSWEDGEVVATFRQPCDLLAETAALASQAGTGEKARTAKTEIWLGN